MEDYVDFLCFRLSAVARRISRSYNKVCAEYGITASQSFILFELLNHEGSSVKDIAARVQLDSPAVTGFIDRLLKEDLVVRVEDKSDRRGLRIYLTDRGKQLANELFPGSCQFNQYIREIIGDDVEELESALARLEEQL